MPNLSSGDAGPMMEMVMAEIPTRETLEAMVEAIHTEAVIRADNDGFDTSALEALDRYAGVGSPANPAFAKAIGPDFICALSDGTVAAWGRDIVLASGVIGRELCFVTAEEQIVDGDGQE